jgi:shikimate kinase
MVAVVRKNIFLVGPASVGKSTAAELLAHRIGYRFVDIDREFCRRLEPIPLCVREKGYPAYCEANSALTDRLVAEYGEGTVFATPSGFLVHEGSPHLVEKHLRLIEGGISVLLLPDVDPQKGVDTVVARQLARWDDLNAETERRRFLERFEKYRNYGDIKIFSLEEPEVIVESILTLLPAAERATIVR